MSRVSEPRWRRTRIGWIALVVLVVAACIVGGVYAAAVFFRTSANAEGRAPATGSASAPSPTSTPTPTPTPTPTKPASPAALSCDSKTTMSVMAHYDDDLLFVNPTLQRAMREGQCVRTVFLTAGDAGMGAAYAGERENGLMKAYDILRGKPGTGWDVTETNLLTGLHVTTVTPKDDPKVSITMIRLPDGNLDGGGFSATGGQWLEGLFDGSIDHMNQIDTGASVSRDELVSSVIELIDAYQPATLVTLVPTAAHWHTGDGSTRADHSDHGAVGSFVREAWKKAEFDEAQVEYAIGYPGANMEPNVSGEELTVKVDAFQVYSLGDTISRCYDFNGCLALGTFGPSLERMHFLSESELEID